MDVTTGRGRTGAGGRRSRRAALAVGVVVGSLGLVGTVTTTAGAQPVTAGSTAAAAATCSAGWTLDRVGLANGFRGYDVDVSRDGATQLVGRQSGHGAMATRVGDRWRTTTVPGTESAYEVASRSADDVWVAGVDGDFADVLTHWDGRAWTPVALPPYLSAEFTGINSIAVTGQGLFVASLTFTDEGARPELGRYDGKRWQRIPGDLPDGHPYSVVLQVEASPTGQVWMVGEDIDTADLRRTAWAATIDQGKAIRVEVPQPTDERASTLLGTLGFAPDGDVLVGGWQGFEEDREQPLLLRRNGSGWTRIALPDVSPGSRIRSVDGIARIGSRVWTATSAGGILEASTLLQPVTPRPGAPITPARFSDDRVIGTAGRPDGTGWLLTWKPVDGGRDDVTRLWRPC